MAFVATTTNLSKDAFSWSEEDEKYFQKMKDIMSNCLVLSLPDFSKPFVLECDASGVGIGAFLMQDRNPIAFESRKLQPHERLYSIYDKEMYSIMHAFENFQQYLVGGKFIVNTDHNSLRHLPKRI